MLKETKQLLDSIVDTAVQAIEVASDKKFDVFEITKFLDEAIGWEKAINGLVTAFIPEAESATPVEVENLFDEQYNKLTGVGVNLMLAGAIVSSLKSVYYTYCAVVQSGQNPIS